MKFCVNFQILFSQWKLALEPAEKYTVVCSKTLAIQHGTFMFPLIFNNFLLHILVVSTA